MSKAIAGRPDQQEFGRIVLPSPLGTRSVSLQQHLLEPAAISTGWELDTRPVSTDPAVWQVDIDNDIPAASYPPQPEYHVLCSDSADRLLVHDGVVNIPHGSRDTWISAAPGLAQQAPLAALEVALFRALALQGALVLHALAYVRHGTGILVLGDSQAGKSTLALAALASGAHLISDDRVVVISRGGAVTAHCMRPFLQARTATIDKFPDKQLPAGLRHVTTGLQPWRLDRSTPDSGMINSGDITHLAVLNAPSQPRPDTHQVGSASQAYLIAQLVRSSLPYAFRTKHPIDWTTPLDLANQLSRSVRIHTLRTGTDLIHDPVASFERLHRMITNGGQHH